MTRNVTPNSSQQSDPQSPREPSGGSERPARTLLLRILVIGFVLLAWFGWVRLYAVFTHQAVLSRYLAPGLLAYAAVGGAAWGLAGLVSAIWLWWGLRHAVQISRWVAVGCFVWYWLDELLLTQSSLSAVNRPFMVAATLLALAFVWWVPTLPKERLFLSRRRLRKS